MNDLRWGVFATLEAPDDYVRECFAQYGLTESADGKYAATYKPFHLIGLELGISVANAALRGESTGSPDDWRGDVVATAKRLKAGEILDGEGGTRFGETDAGRRSAEDRRIADRPRT